uniref:Uncharacterized protein n=1 Tax=Nelumbo nucifera TaxID=4432 RepID=A0A822YWB3_NELNU|nr:TPA_asm: hypothetical protein HUJ06_009015 [Nelumbo nucifera]
MHGCSARWPLDHQYPYVKLSFYYFSLFTQTNEPFMSGFNVETVDYKNISFTVWDVGGQDKVCMVILS